jgi:hypothetical protein
MKYQIELTDEDGRAFEKLRYEDAARDYGISLAVPDPRDQLVHFPITIVGPTDSTFKRCPALAKGLPRCGEPGGMNLCMERWLKRTQCDDYRT